MALDPRKDISDYPEIIQILMRGDLPDPVPHWLKVDPSHPKYATANFEPEPVPSEPELSKREQYEKDHPNGE